MNMIRTLAGLFIVVSVLPISVLAYRFTGNIPFEYSEVSDELCLNALPCSLIVGVALVPERDETQVAGTVQRKILGSIDDAGGIGTHAAVPLVGRNFLQAS